MAGVDEALLRPRSIAAKIAALLPFPLWRLPGGSRGAKAASADGSHHVAAPAPPACEVAGSAITFGQAAATVGGDDRRRGRAWRVHGLAPVGTRAPPAVHRSAHQASPAVRYVRPRRSAARPPGPRRSRRLADGHSGRVLRRRGRPPSPAARPARLSAGPARLGETVERRGLGATAPARARRRLVPPASGNGAAKTANGVNQTVNGAAIG